MIFDFRCLKCKKVFEGIAGSNTRYLPCQCGSIAEKQFRATTNFHIPSYWHTSRSDVFTDKEWQDLKKDPNIERA